MANFDPTGVSKARTSFARFANLAALRQALLPFDIELVAHPDGQRHMLLSTCESGSTWPLRVSLESDDGVWLDLEFRFEECVVPFLESGQALIALEAGAGGAAPTGRAWTWDGSSARTLTMLGLPTARACDWGGVASGDQVCASVAIEPPLWPGGASATGSFGAAIDAALASAPPPTAG